jgi:hypothetical protein
MERVLTDNSVLAKGQKECLQSVFAHLKISISRKYLESLKRRDNMSYSITIVDFNKGDSFLAKVTQSKSNPKKFKLFVTDKYELAKKFDTDSDANKMMKMLENKFSVEVQLNS